MTRETMLKNEIQQLNEQIAELRRQHANELEQLGQKNVAEVQKLMEQIATQESSEHGRESELVYYERHLEAVEQIDELRETVAQQQIEIYDLQETLRCRDAEVEQLKVSVSVPDSATDTTSYVGLLAAIQSDLERVSAERLVLIIRELQHPSE